MPRRDCRAPPCLRLPTGQMIFFDTPLPSFWLILLALAAAGVLALAYSRLQRLVRPSYAWTLSGLRLWSFVALFLLLVNPYRLERQPDRDGFRIAVLVDASGSMDTRDLDGGTVSRFELVRGWLKAEGGSPLKTLSERGYRLDISLFAEDSRPFAGGDVTHLPGSTAMGTVLREELSAGRGADSQLGGVLIISDGRSNLGPSPVEVAQEFRQRGIPVSTIGVGSLQPPGEVRAEFVHSRYGGEKGSPLNLDVRLSNTSDSAETVRVELHQDALLAESREVDVPANSEQTITFNILPTQAGGQAYRVVTHRDSAPSQTDITAVQIDEPERFRILYLAARPSLEFRFIRQAVAAAEQMEVEAVIRTSGESFFHSLRPEQETMAGESGFPTDPGFYNGYDAIILHESMLEEPGETAAPLRDFVQHRGGGLLFLGGGNNPPEEWRALLPVTEAASRAPSAPLEVEVEVAPIFHEVAGGTLFGRPAPFLPDDLPAMLATGSKRGARPVLRLADGNDILMAIQAYGAGRIGWIGTDNTWRWRMQSNTGLEQHRIFWNHTLVWLASSGRPRLTVAAQGSRVPLGTLMDAGIDVRGADFRPAHQADVEATVISPTGETSQVRLQPSFRQPGRFETEFQPDEAGAYRLRYRVALPEGEELTHDAFFIASHHNREREDTSYREDLLRDIARVTDGVFRHHDDAQNLRDIPLADGIPTQESRRYLAHNWVFLVLLALPLFSEWYIRRKLGLK